MAQSVGLLHIFPLGILTTRMLDGLSIMESNTICQESYSTFDKLSIATYLTLQSDHANDCSHEVYLLWFCSLQLECVLIVILFYVKYNV